MSKKVSKMSLKSYYEQLPFSVSPKTEFVNKVSLECGVSTATVRNWIGYGMKPQNPDHIKVLSRLTGIPEDELWS